MHKEIGALVKNDKSPCSKMKGTNMDRVVWKEGFWKRHFEICLKVSLPHLYDLMNDPSKGHVTANLKIAAGKEEGNYAGTNWHDEWAYKWIEAASMSYMYTKDEKIDKLMDELIEIISKAQMPDGYIATQIQVRGWKRYQDNRHHELYVMGHLITAACLHSRITGKDSFLRIAVKVADYMYDTFSKRIPEMDRMHNNPTNIMALVDLYRLTGNKKYLDAAAVFIDMHGSGENGTERNQDRVPLRKETQASGHMVLGTYLYCGATDYCLETGDQELMDALERVWKDLYNMKTYINGGVCAIAQGLAVRRDENGCYMRQGKTVEADWIVEGVGDEYELGNATAYNETCSQIGSFMWNWRLLLLKGEARFAEMMEHTLYNGILCSIGEDGKAWFYTNKLRWYGKHQRLHMHDKHLRHDPDLKNCCCPTNAVRTLSELSNYLYSVDDVV